LQKSDKKANGLRDQYMVCRLADNNNPFLKQRRKKRDYTKVNGQK